jgi:hypothetical protein
MRVDSAQQRSDLLRLLTAVKPRGDAAVARMSELIAAVQSAECDEAPAGREKVRWWKRWVT